MINLFDDLKPGMLTYEDAEPVRVRKPEIIMEPVPRRGLLGRIKDRILGPVMKPHAVMVLSKVDPIQCIVMALDLYERYEGASH